MWFVDFSVIIWGVKSFFLFIGIPKSSDEILFVILEANVKQKIQGQANKLFQSVQKKKHYRSVPVILM